jgi:hypothetical protein
VAIIETGVLKRSNANDTWHSVVISEQPTGYPGYLSFAFFFHRFGGGLTSSARYQSLSFLKMRQISLEFNYIACR